MEWLTKTPQSVVNAHLEMLPQLEAEESKAKAIVTGVGFRLLKPSSLKRAWARLSRAIKRRGPVEAAKPTDLVALGIGLRKV